MSGAICVLLFFIPTFAKAVAKPSINFEANIHLVNFSAEHEKKVRDAVALIKRVVTSDEFRRRVLEHHYHGERTFVDNLGLSNEEIYQRIIDGAELLHPERNGKMDVQLELYHQNSTTIGYTYPHTSRIWMNTKYFSTYTSLQVADNLFHEWMHKLGFDHATKYSISRKFSVPYALGYLVEELAAKELKASENLNTKDVL